LADFANRRQTGGLFHGQQEAIRSPWRWTSASRRINEIVHGKRRVTPDTALRLARYFNMSAAFWLGLQMDYDLDTAEDELADRIKREVQVYTAAGPR
jgi:transcriptional regulator with XRE-family HTH domain